MTRKARKYTHKSAAAMRRNAAATSRQLSRQRCAESQRRADRGAALAERRRLRLAELTNTRHVAERDELRASSSALVVAAESAADRKRQRRAAASAREVLAARQRDEWTQAHADAPMTALGLVALVVGVGDELPRVTDDERAESVAYMLAKIGERYGWQPSAADVERGWLRARMAGRIADERQRAQRWIDSAAWAAMADDDESDSDERAAAISRNVWSAFVAPSATRELRAAEVGAEWLADQLGLASDDERLALTAALSDKHRQAPELAAALGISEAATRKRLSRGKAALRERYPSAAELIAAVREVQAADDERFTLSPELRAAAELIDGTRHAAYNAAKARTGSAPVSAGRWNGGRAFGGACSALPLADALGAAKRRRAAELRAAVAAELAALARRELRRRWLATLAADKLRKVAELIAA